MITIKNRSFDEVACVRSKNNLNVKNVALDGSKYGFNQGFNYSYSILLEQITKEELNFLEDLNFKFVFVDSENRKINARIFDNISVDNKFKFENKIFYDVSFAVEEVVK